MNDVLILRIFNKCKFQYTAEIAVFSIYKYWNVIDTSVTEMEQNCGFHLRKGEENRLFLQCLPVG